jgi:NAD(P)-dependent dehydrogenase (short-subunit alcohol dehydrogenase family)
MSNRNILIAGATSGIGLELSKLFVAGHDNVYSYSRSETHPETAVQHTSIDLSAAAPETSQFPETIDGLVYCPGSINLKPFHRISADEWLQELNVNLLGAVKLLQAAHSGLKKSGAASVVLFSTVAVQTGMPFHASVSASKGAVEGLARSLAAEWAPGIRVNVIAPSLTDTPLAAKLLSTPEKRDAGAQRHPLRRIGTAAEMAATAKFLLSNDASWITGQVIHADGGMSALRLL